MPPIASRAGQAGPSASSSAARIAAAGSRSSLACATRWSARPPSRPCAPNSEGLPATQRGAPLQADERVGRVGLEAVREHRRVDAREAGRVGAQRVGGIGGEGAGGEHVEAGDGEPLGAREHGAARVAVAPARARAGIEQDGDDGELEGGAQPRGGPSLAEGARERRPPVLSSDDEVPPARMEGHVARWIGLARRARDQLRAPVEAREVEREMRRRAGLCCGEDVRAAGAYRRRVAEPRQRGRFGRARHSSRPLPFGRASSPAAGTAPGA